MSNCSVFSISTNIRCYLSRCSQPNSASHQAHQGGHAGTLDPLATGVLVVAVGSATRLTEYVQRGKRRYEGTFLFGKNSDTEDIEEM